jgi:hypothetical protein
MLHPALSIIILLEVLSGLLIAYGFTKEEKIVQFEDQIIKKILRK